jgi:heterodisulfide reductase subunit A2
MTLTNAQSEPSVLIVGAGIAGMQAALDLAAMNHTVILLERSASIGGNMGRLDKTFPTNDCSTCMISPRMVACARHSRIRIMTLAEVRNVTGEPGHFQATVTQHPRYVDEKLCIGCGLCVQKCPKKVPNAYNAAMDTRKAIHFVHSQAIPLVPSIDTEACIYFQKGRCRVCEKVCPTQAVRLQDQARIATVTAGAVILAAGYDLALVAQAGEYGHGRYANVVTSLEYERMLSATGPHGGHLKRPADGQTPRKIAWIQCVASRDSARGRNFCSSVCCMAAVKQALLTREHYPESQATVFFLDVRAHGKDFDRYVLRARDNYGVRLVRSMLSQVIQNPVNHNLVIEYYDRHTLEHRQEEFDLVVLGAGMKPSQQIVPLIERLGLELNSYGFIAPNLDEPSLTSRGGIFVCGALDGPKDIPEAVTGASAAAASAAVLLRRVAAQPGLRPSERNGSAVVQSLVSSLPSPGDEIQPSALAADSKAPRIGVFICHCGRNIAGVVHVEAVRDFARTLPHVEIAEDFQFTCSTSTQERIKELVLQHRLNRVVVAACSPRTHEPLFRETLQQAGLNQYLFEMANIRDQCSWVHGQEPEAATVKARRLVEAAVARAALLEPIEEAVTQVVPRALIIGGGLAGMTAALNLAEQGLGAILVEREDHLGGMARQLHHTLEGRSPQRLAEELATRVHAHSNITVRTSTTVRAISGGAGHFTGGLEHAGETVEAEFGAVIVATGGIPYRPEEYLYGEHPSVVTQLELEQRLFTAAGRLPQTTVMIQCVGSRRDDFPLCSRICCAAAVKNAIRLMEMNPSGSVYVLYRDVRTFGFKEEYYRRARDLGAIFIQFDPETAPVVTAENGGLQVKVFDPASQLDLVIRTDLLVLSSGVRPHPAALDIARKLKLPRMQEGFFMEAHPKLSPLDFSSSGLFLCGLAHSPRFVEESLAQARGAACRAAGLLRQPEIYTSGAVAQVDRTRCSSCLVCVRSCPYHVPVIDQEGISVIDPRGCQGCGICAAECPAKAIILKHCTDGQMMAQARGSSGRSPHQAGLRPLSG